MIALITEKDGKLNARLLSEDSKIGDIYNEIKNADRYEITHETVDMDPYRRWTNLQSHMNNFKENVLRDQSLNFTEEQKKLMWDMLDVGDKLFKLFY